MPNNDQKSESKQRISIVKMPVTQIADGHLFKFNDEYIELAFFQKLSRNSEEMKIEIISRIAITPKQFKIFADGVKGVLTKLDKKKKNN